MTTTICKSNFLTDILKQAHDCPLFINIVKESLLFAVFNTNRQKMLMCMKKHIVMVDSKGVNVDVPALL